MATRKTPVARKRTQAAAPAPQPPRSKKKPARPKPTKLVRETFVLPKPERAAIDALKLRATALDLPTKKSALLRAALAALAALPDARLADALRSLPPVVRKP